MCSDSQISHLTSYGCPIVYLTVPFHKAGRAPPSRPLCPWSTGAELLDPECSGGGRVGVGEPLLLSFHRPAALILWPCRPASASPLVIFAKSDNLFIIQQRLRSVDLQLPREKCAPGSPPPTLAPSPKSSTSPVRPAPREKVCRNAVPRASVRKGGCRVGFPCRVLCTLPFSL